MTNFELEQIIDHIESVLNKPIIDMLIQKNKENKELKKIEKEMDSLSQNSSIDSRKNI